MAKAQARPGFASLSGASNPKITVGTEKPKAPKQGDVNVDFVRFIFSVYDGAAWNDMQCVYVSDTEPTNTNLLWLDIS